MNNRRKIIVAFGTYALTAPLAAFAQQQRKIWRIGVLSSGNSETHGFRIDAFVQGLAKLGYSEGSNISLVVRFADGNPDRLPALAADLVAKKVDIILSQNSPTTRAAKQATSNIPIVFASVGDPVGYGFVASLAKPAGNITGLSAMTVDLAAKRLQILKEIFPRIARVAIVTGGAQAAQVTEAERAAKALGMQTLAVQLERREDVKQVAARLKEWRADSFDFLDGGINLYNRKLLGEFAVTMRLPAVAAYKEFVEAGALISYGLNSVANYIRAATYVDKILKGAKPGDLPVEQPTQFEMVINMKTAKALGVKIPDAVLARADKVIE
jgi:putative tryptophan/tyrosine transport system substrate-binding protein